MAERGLEWKVGLTVLAATILFIGGVFYLSQKELGRPGPEVRVSFPEVGGLNVGDPVMVSGLRRGAVSSLDLGVQQVVVTLKLRPDVVLHSDAMFSVENMGIMGEKFVAIDPGVTEDSLDTRLIIVGGYSPGITEAMSQLGIVLEDMGSIVARVEEILQDHEVVEPLGETVRLMRDISIDLQAILDENRGDLRVSIENFRSMSEQMDEMVRSNREKVDTTLTHAALASARFDRTTERLESAAESLELVLKRLEHGQGTLGRLSRDDKLYKELLQTTQNLNDLVRDIRKNPKRYVNIELF